MGDFLNNYPETNYPASATQPATSTSTSAFGSTNNNQESQQAGNTTSYANTQIDPQLVSNSFKAANAGKQPSSYGQNQAMASYDMQDCQNGSNNNMNYDPQFNTFNSNMGGYQNNYSDMSYGTANQQQQHAQQQQHFYDRQQQQGSGFQREVSDNFGTVSAGPPSPGKMDMLPHGHTNHYTSSSTNPPNPSILSAQQQQKTRPPNANAQGGGEYDGSSQASHLARAPTTKGSSTTSEFTKRKNWSQRIVEEMQDVLHVLSPSGIFLFISPSIYEITGYTPEELVGRGITDFIERDDIDNFTRDFSESIQTNQALTTYIRFRRKDEQGVLFEVTGQPYYTTATSSPQNNMVRTSSSSSNTNDSNSPADATMSSRKPPPSSSTNETVCKCFFAMARLYPGKNNAMLDSFLELKMENEKLRERLAEIYREIEGDNVEANIVAGTSIIDTTASISTMGSEGTNEPRQISGYPSRLLGQNQQNQNQQPIQPSPSNPYAMSTENEVPKSATSSNFPSTFYNYPTSSAQNPYSTQNLQQIQPNNNNNNNSNNNQYNADASTSQLRGTAISQDSLLVSSAGLLPSSGNTYGALGIGISNNAHRNNNNNSGPSNQYTSNNAQKGANNQDYAGDASMRDDGDPANKKKKPKKQRVDEGEFVCRDCGTVDSPEWRRGPQGPKTLCNACGLRWAKKNKQSRNSIGGMEGIA